MFSGSTLALSFCAPSYFGTLANTRVLAARDFCTHLLSTTTAALPFLRIHALLLVSVPYPPCLASTYLDVHFSRNAPPSLLRHRRCRYTRIHHAPSLQSVHIDMTIRSTTRFVVLSKHHMLRSCASWAYYHTRLQTSLPDATIIKVWRLITR
jgi:hypothetical protein